MSPVSSQEMASIELLDPDYTRDLTSEIIVEGKSDWSAPKYDAQDRQPYSDEDAEDKTRQLFERAQAGDTEALGELCEQYQGVVGHESSRNKVLDSDDVKQDAWEGTIKYFPKIEYRDSRRLGALLGKIASRRRNSHYRNLKQQAKVTMVHLSDETNVPAVTNGPEQVVDSIASDARVAQILSHLTKGQAETFAAVIIDGLSYMECAEKQDIALGTVQSRINRARETFQKLIDSGELKLTEIDV